MKSLFTLLFLALCCITKVSAQTALTADAGPDRYWCQDMAKSGTDTPRLGGAIAASGGVPPYTYQWSFRTVTNTFTNRYLDSFTLANPLVTEVPISSTLENTAIALLVVQDANGVVARDSVAIFFQKIRAGLGSIGHTKNIDDTIRIGAEVVFDQFPPFHNYRWSPASTLVDSTERNPLCFASRLTEYNVSYVDSVGCFLCCSQAVVDIRPTAIAPAPNSPNARATAFIGADRQLTVYLPGTKKGKILLYSLDGKKLLEQDLNEPQPHISLQEIPLGVFLYKIRTMDGAQYDGKLSTLSK